MRPFIPYALFAALCVAVVFKNHPLPFASQPNPTTVYDSTILMVKDFVANGDLRLGFSNPSQLDSAYIDFTHGLPLNYLCEDTLLGSNKRLQDQVMNMRRVMYPVYTKVNGQDKLCATFTFDSTGGIHPVMIDDSTLILPHLRNIARHHHKHSKEDKVVFAPSFYNYIFLTHGEEGDNVIGTKQLEIGLGEDYPIARNPDKNVVTPIDLATFQKAMVKHLKKRHNIK